MTFRAELNMVPGTRWLELSQILHIELVYCVHVNMEAKKKCEPKSKPLSALSAMSNIILISATMSSCMLTRGRDPVVIDDLIDRRRSYFHSVGKTVGPVTYGCCCQKRKLSLFDLTHSGYCIEL